MWGVKSTAAWSAWPAATDAVCRTVVGDLPSQVRQGPFPSCPLGALLPQSRSILAKRIRFSTYYRAQKH